MPEFVRKVISQLHSFVGTSNSVNRRAMNLPLTISLPPVNGERSGVSRPACDGHTHDFSKTGLSFIVRSLRIGNNHIFYDINSRLLIKVGLPNGLVEMYVVPVRFDRWGESETESKYIVGVRIVEVSKSDHARYMEFISKRQPEFADVVNSAASNSASTLASL